MIYRFPKSWRYPQASFRSCVGIHHEKAALFVAAMAQASLVDFPVPR